MPGPLPTFIAAFCISALAGVAYILTPKRKDGTLHEARPMPEVLAHAALNSGLLGLCTALIGWPYFRGTEEGIYQLVGISGLMGLAGVTAQLVWKIVSKSLRTMISKADDDAPRPNPYADPNHPANADS